MHDTLPLENAAKTTLQPAGRQPATPGAAPTDAQTLAAAGTAVISDVFDTLGLEPPVLANSLSPIGPAQTFAGPAYTVTGTMAKFQGGDHAKLHAIDNMPPGVVALWAGTDAQGVCCFGDLLATSMRARGVLAAVVDGGVRDTSFLATCGLPVLARYRTPAQGVGRWRVTAAQIPVLVRGALTDWLTVNPGDLIVGDADGVIVLPQTLVPEITAKVRAWSATENLARTEIAAGLPLLQALEKFGHL